MYTYAALASLGDDVYHEPSTLALEAHMAKLTGKEAALFMPSGTMSNQIALRTHLRQPPYSVLCDHRAHIAGYLIIGVSVLVAILTKCRYEAGGVSFHSGAHLECVMPANRNNLVILAGIEYSQTNLPQGTTLHWKM